MKPRQINDANIEIILPQDIYTSYLATINEIPLTRREVDIISCVLGGRSAKKIASFLSIAPKTVEHHIRNVMLKLGCQSQEGIRDFIEKSGKFNHVKKYYASLLIQDRFELELNKISTLGTEDKPSCLIVYENEQQDKLPLIRELEKHLKLTGIKTLVEARDRHQSTSKLIDKIESRQVNYIIYSLPITFEEFRAENLGASDFIQATNKHQDSIVILLLDRKPSVNIPKQLLDLSCIDLTEQRNYYFLVFETLKKLLPNIIIDKNISEFKLQYEILHDSSLPQEEVEKNEISSKESTNDEFLSIFKKGKNKVSLYSGIFLISIFVFILVYSSDKFQNNKNKEIKSLNAQSSPSISLDPLQTQIKTGESISWNLPRQDHAFVGREELLNELDKELGTKEKLNLNKPVMVSVYAGLGGVGKTQLALQYMHHSKHPYTLRAWFVSENLDQLRQQYIEFAKTLGYREEKPSIKTALPYIKEWLSKNPGWLLVYDNVNSYEEIKEFLPGNNGSIILTTRQKKWPSAFKTLDIDVMSEAESVVLVQSLINQKIVEREKESVKELVKMLGYLPLALAQASAYIRQNQITISEYLEFYKNHEQKLLADNTLPAGTNNLPVAINWDISLEAIIKEAKTINQPPLAIDLLSACAYLAPEKIPRNLLLTWLKESHPNLASPELVLTKLIGQLWQYSMIHREDNGDITVHRLVQAAVRHKHKQVLNRKRLDCPPLTLEWYNILIRSAHTEFHRRTQILEDEMRQKKLLPHLQVLLNHNKQIWPDELEFSTAPIINDIGTALFLIGEVKFAKFYYECALSTLEQYYGMKHFELTYTLDQLGKAYRYLGDAEQAKDIHERALQIKEKYHGKDHIQVSETLDQLGRDYRYLGDAKQAKEIHERALRIKEQHYVKDHFEIAYTLHQLGNDYRYLGDIKKAKEVHERALKINEQYYGMHHFEVANTLNQLGRDYRYLGDVEQAKEIHQRALKIKEKIYDEDHVEVSYTLDQLGHDYRLLGDAKQAKEIHERALKIKEQFYGKDHFEIALTLDKLGIDYRYLGDAKQAKEIHERALKIKERFYGNNHKEMAEAFTNLGCVYTALDNPEKGKRYLEKALIIEESYYGMDHPEVAETLIELSNAYKALKDTKQAQIHLKRALKIREQYFGRNHILTVETRRAIN
jgi:tetratricopeptide (TPR) repeat protein/DNA-binding CsgD family transcriptional regulator